MPFSFPSVTDLNPRAWVDVRASESTLIGTGAMSIAAWVWFDPRWNDGSQREIVCFNDGAGSNSQTFFGVSVLTLEFARKYTTTDGNWLGLNLTPRNGPIPTGRWTFVGVTHDGGTTNKADFFMWDPVDGLFYAGANNSYGPTPPVGTPSVPGVGTWIGRSTYRSWPGGLAHVQIWKRTLTSLEMQQAMRRPGSVRSSLTGYWPLERTAEDRSPTPAHGTVYGAVRRDVGKFPRLPHAVSIARQSRFRPTYDALAAGGTVVTPGVGSLTLTGFAPTVALPVGVSAGLGALTLAGLAPTILTPRVVLPGVGALTLTGLAGSVLSAPLVVLSLPPRTALFGASLTTATFASPTTATISPSITTATFDRPRTATFP